MLSVEKLGLGHGSCILCGGCMDGDLGEKSEDGIWDREIVREICIFFWISSFSPLPDEDTNRICRLRG